MSDVPIRELQRLERHFESQSKAFPEDSTPKRVCEWAQEQVQEVIEDHE